MGIAKYWWQIYNRLVRKAKSLATGDRANQP